MFERISAQERIDFTKNLALMLRSGIVINEALKTFTDQKTSRFFKGVLQRINKDIESGTLASEAFQKENKVFDTVYISLLRMGESSGTLGEALDFLALWLERDHDLKTDIRQATLYPKLLLSATGLLATGLAVFILPRLVPLFSSLNIELPLMTRILLAVSIFFRDHWFVVFAGIVGFIIFYILVRRIKKVHYMFDLLSLRIPFIGSLMVDYQLAMITHVFATVFHSGMSMIDTMNVTRIAATNTVYKKALDQIKLQVQTGISLAEALRKYEHLFPKSAIVIISVGERTGKLGDSMEYLSDFYTKQLRTKTKRLPTVLEPALLVFVALVVGLVAVSIITPIYELTQGL
ncbi:MAG: type II secretion system F family protein [Candidatus Pacebacteria bacterium]|nr:type II secretion system F family protein [Candidatus Paceibacterota bacterium]